MNPRLIRSRMSFDRQLASRPLRVNVTGPFCLTCQKAVDSEELVEDKHGNVNLATVIARCHGQEEVRTFEMGSQEWDERDLQRAMQRCAWFDPTQHNEVASVANSGKIDD